MNILVVLDGNDYDEFLLKQSEKAVTPIPLSPTISKRPSSQGSTALDQLGQWAWRVPLRVW